MLCITCSIYVSCPGGEGVLPYMGYIGMCGPKGYGFSAVLVTNRVSILADLGHKLGMVFTLALIWVFFKRKPLFHHYGEENQQKPFTNYFYGNLTFAELGN